MSKIECNKCNKAILRAVDHEFCAGEMKYYNPYKVVKNSEEPVFSNHDQIISAGERPHHPTKVIYRQKPITNHLVPSYVKPPVQSSLKREYGNGDKDGLIDESYSANGRKYREG